MRDLGTAPGESSGQATAINEVGQIIGHGSGYFGGAAFLWQNGKMTGLPGPRKLSSYAMAISERGQVVGFTNDEDCHVSCARAVLWTRKP